MGSKRVLENAFSSNAEKLLPFLDRFELSGSTTEAENQANLALRLTTFRGKRGNSDVRWVVIDYRAKCQIDTP